MNEMTLGETLMMLREIQNELYFDPGDNWPEEFFRTRIYEQGTIKDIRRLIKKNWGKKKPIEVINDYCEHLSQAIDAYDGYSLVVPEMLRIMLNTAEDIGCEFC